MTDRKIREEKIMQDSERRVQLLRQWADPVSVLDHGYVRIIDVMGDDLRVEEAARISYLGSTRRLTDTRNLIRSLMRDHHTTPFEKCLVEIEIKMPIFVARQFVRHRTQSINEKSARYTELDEEFYVPAPGRMAGQATLNKQASGTAEDLEEDPAILVDWVREAQENAYADYGALLEAGLSRELSRVVTSVGMYTTWTTTINLHNLLHFLNLRDSSHAQYEARVYAIAIAQFVADWVPLSWEAYLDYRKNAVVFSRMELEILKAAFLDRADLGRFVIDSKYAANVAAEAGISSAREIEGFIGKINKAFGTDKPPFSLQVPLPFGPRKS